MLKKICSWIIGVILTVLVLLIGIFAFWYFGSTNYHLTGVPVLNYHQVNNKFNTVLTMKPANFDEQMKYLHDNDYHSITLEQFDAYMRGEGDLPDRPVLITFDDATSTTMKTLSHPEEIPHARHHIPDHQPHEYAGLPDLGPGQGNVRRRHGIRVPHHQP